MNLAGNPELKWLECHYNQLKTLDFSENKKLHTVDCGGNPIERLDISGLPELEWLNCNYARLDSLDISKNEKLRVCHYSGNRIKSVAGIENLLMEKIIIENEQKTQLLPPADGTVDEGIPIDKGHFPDYALRYEVLADFDTNHDGVLSEKESLVEQPLKLKKF